MADPELNPFAPPASDIASAGAAAPAAATDLATRGRRLWGATVDGLAMLLAVSPAYVGVSFAALADARKTDHSPFLLYKMGGIWGVVGGVLALAFTCFNWYLLTARGQTVGKMVARTRVTLVDGRRAPFGRVVALRQLPLFVLGYVPVIGTTVAPALYLIDVLMIFRADRRCLHDLVAGTKVVRADAA